VILNSPVLYNNKTEVYYRDPSTFEIVGDVFFKVLKDHWGNYKYFEWDRNNNKNILRLKVSKETVMEDMLNTNRKVLLLEIQPMLLQGFTS
jgi:hypothetical protein